jgi:hypothetical protein
VIAKAKTIRLFYASDFFRNEAAINRVLNGIRIHERKPIAWLAERRGFPGSGSLAADSGPHRLRPGKDTAKWGPRRQERIILPFGIVWSIRNPFQ